MRDQKVYPACLAVGMERTAVHMKGLHPKNEYDCQAGWKEIMFTTAKPHASIIRCYRTGILACKNFQLPLLAVCAQVVSFLII